MNHTPTVEVDCIAPGQKQPLAHRLRRPIAAKTKSFGTFSIAVGTPACDAKCPFCVSRMTPDDYSGNPAQKASFEDLNRMSQALQNAALFARQASIKTVLITGKGEPTLSPGEITFALTQLKEYQFPIVELQTNGLRLSIKPEEYNFHLGMWRALGLQTIAISVAHYQREMNAKVYTPNGNYMDLPALIARLRGFGFSVRLSVVMASGFIDSVEGLKSMVEFGRQCDIQQLTLRPVERPAEALDQSVHTWVGDHYLPEENLLEIEQHILDTGKLLDVLPHGALVVDYEGRNLCLSNCLTFDPQGDEIRQIILFLRTARLVYSWEHSGATIF